MKANRSLIASLGLSLVLALLCACVAMPTQKGGYGEYSAGPAPLGGLAGKKAKRTGAAEQPVGPLQSYAALKKPARGSGESSGATPTRVDARMASAPAVQQLPPTPAGGLYRLDAQLGFDTLESVSFNPAQGTLALTGHRARGDGRANVPYLDLLAAALDSDQPVFSLEWTAASERDVDRAMAYFSNDRNNEDLTTRMSKIFDANGRLNRKGVGFFKALGVRVQEGMNKYEFNSAMLTAAGRPRAGEALRTFGAMVEAIKRGDRASSYLENLANALNLYDFINGKVNEMRAGRITMNDVLDSVMPRIMSGLADAFGWDDRRYVNKYWQLRRSGHSCESASDEALFDLQKDLNTLPRQALDAITADVSEVVVSPETMREVLGVEPRVRPVLMGLPDRTRLALIACEADQFCKTLFDQPGLAAKVPGYQGYFAWLRNRGQRPVTGNGHLWISPGNFELLESADRQTLGFGRTPMQFNIERYAAGRRSVAHPQLTAYADMLTGCYDDIAREHPVLHQLRESVKLVAVAQWLKQRGHSVTLPRAGREEVNLPPELPGVIYMVMAIKNGPVGEILTAAGGVDYNRDGGWRYAPRDMESRQTDLADRTGQQVREKMEQIFKHKADAPRPRPLAEVKSESIGGRKVTTVTVGVGAGDTGPAAGVLLQQLPEDEALRLWKAGDLKEAEQAYLRQIESVPGDPRQEAALRALLAQVYHEMGDNQRARQELEKARSLDAGAPIFRLLYAYAQENSGDRAGAIETLKEYLKSDSQNQAAAELLRKLQAGQPGGGTPPMPGALRRAAIEGVALSDGSIEADKDRDWVPDTSNLQKLALTGRGPELPEYVSKDSEIVVMQQQRDEVLDTQKTKADEIEKLQQKFEAAAKDDEVKRSELAAQAAQLKAEVALAELKAAKLNHEIQKRTKLLIDTHVEEQPATPKPGPGGELDS